MQKTFFFIIFFPTIMQSTESTLEKELYKACKSQDPEKAVSAVNTYVNKYENLPFRNHNSKQQALQQALKITEQQEKITEARLGWNPIKNPSRYAKVASGAGSIVLGLWNLGSTFGLFGVEEQGDECSEMMKNFTLSSRISSILTSVLAIGEGAYLVGKALLNRENQANWRNARVTRILVANEIDDDSDHADIGSLEVVQSPRDSSSGVDSISSVVRASASSDNYDETSCSGVGLPSSDQDDADSLHTLAGNPVSIEEV